MSYLALARTWRPKTFSELLGQNHLSSVLINSLDKNRIHHAYLFTGTRGVGKTSVARLFAKALNCEQGISSNPCLQCDACHSIEQGRFIDLIEIDGASRTRVEDTRELLDNVQYAPTSGRFKIYLIDEVHMLSQHSFNALLKTLEEPPEHVKFLLATTDPQKLPVTVLSRCLQFNLKHISEETICSHLQNILESEGLTYDISALSLIAKAARGSMRDALSLLDQAIAGCNQGLVTSYIKEMLGFTQNDYALPILMALLAKNSKQLLDISNTIAMDGGQFSYVLEQLIYYLHQIAVCQALKNNNGLVNASDEIKLLSQNFTPEDTQLMYQITIKGLDEILLSPSISIGFEMTLLRMQSFSMAPLQKKPILSEDSHSMPSKVKLYPADSKYIAPKTTNNLNNELEQKLGKTIELSHNIQPNKTKSDINNSINHQINISSDETSINKAQESRTNPTTIESKTINITTQDESVLSWVELLPKLKLKGLALSAAENAQISKKSPGRIVLQIEKAHQSIFTPQVQKQIEQSLSTFYNEKTQITLEYTDKIVTSPAIQKKNKQNNIMNDATLALQNDQFFQQLQNEFSAELQKNSITVLQNKE